MNAAGELARILGAAPARLAQIVSAPVVLLDQAPDGATALIEGQWFVAGEPPLVAVGISSDAITVAVPGVVWNGQIPRLKLDGTTTRSSRSDEPVTEWVLEAAERAITTRLATFATCEECHEATPPEWLHDTHLCQSCAAANHDIVY
ncbi:hypothetical protein ACE2AJ_00450 [Aquihabitans daechungensis]|uniref:hypothetical protein n=1 Tax=Aquihabitans daechungensis TaxID=1052257 RepID=UPI003BA0E615